jgi:hypothetical protein
MPLRVKNEEELAKLLGSGAFSYAESIKDAIAEQPTPQLSPAFEQDVTQSALLRRTLPIPEKPRVTFVSSSKSYRVNGLEPFSLFSKQTATDWPIEQWTAGAVMLLLTLCFFIC